MAHHSSDFPLDQKQIDEFNYVRRAMNRYANDIEARMREALGATGPFPEGKYSEHDDGEIRKS